MSIEHPPLASERALYASLVTPAPEPHDPRTCEFCTTLRGERAPMPQRRHDGDVVLRLHPVDPRGIYVVWSATDLADLFEVDEPIPYRLSEVGPMVESLEQSRLARVADGPVSLLPPEVEP